MVSWINLIEKFVLEEKNEYYKFITNSIDQEAKNIYDYGLKQKWEGICWMNPPYGREISKWMKKAYEESLNGATIVCLVPSRTDTIWWHEYAMKGEVRLIKGRLRFKGAQSSAPFPSAIVIFGPNAKRTFQ